MNDKETHLITYLTKVPYGKIPYRIVSMMVGQDFSQIPEKSKEISVTYEDRVAAYSNLLFQDFPDYETLLDCLLLMTGNISYNHAMKIIAKKIVALNQMNVVDLNLEGYINVLEQLDYNRPANWIVRLKDIFSYITKLSAPSTIQKKCLQDLKAIVIQSNDRMK